MLYSLVKYITEEPSHSATHEEIYKFPFVASLFFNINFIYLLKAFYEETGLIEQLLNFLRNDEELLPTIAGYFSKACDSLISISPHDFLRIFYSEKYHFYLVFHLATSSLVELTGKILCFSAKYKEFSGGLLEIIGMLIKRLSFSESLLETINAQQVLVKYIQNPSISDQGLIKKELFEDSYLYNENPTDFLRRIATDIFTDQGFLTSLFKNTKGKDPLMIESTLKVLIAILFKFTFNTDTNDYQDNCVIEAFKENLDAIFDILASNPTKFTADKIIAYEIVKVLCMINNPKLHDKIIESNILSLMTSIFENFPICTILHNSYLNLVSTILVSNFENIKKHLLEKVKLPDIIVKHGGSPLMKSRNCMIRKGFIGHLHTIANLLLKIDDSDSFIDSILDRTDGWFQFVSNVLVKQNLIENKQLGGEGFENFFDKNSSDDERNNIETDITINLGENNIQVVENVTKNDEIVHNVNEEEYIDHIYWAIPIEFNIFEDL